MRGDKQGPENRGPKTGRGLGYCNGNDRPGYESTEAPQGMGRGNGAGFGPGGGRGFRMGRPMGRGFGRGRGMSFSSENREILDRLATIEKQLEKLEGK